MSLKTEKEKDPLEAEIEKEETLKQQPKAKLKYGKKTELLKQLITETGLTDHKSIVEKWKEQHPDIKPPSRSYTDQIVKLTTAQPEQPKPPEEKPVVTEPTQEEIKKAEEAASKPLAEVARGILEGKIKKESIKALFLIENKMLSVLISDQFQHDPDTIDLLASIWEQPLNRIFQKYADKNIDLYVAIGITLYAHLPLILKLWKSRPKKEKPKNEAETSPI